MDANLQYPIINCIWFQDRIVCVNNRGVVFTVSTEGTPSLLWSNDIAVAYGNTGGWVATEFCSFAIFNDNLLICDGINKPLVVNTRLSRVCDYIKNEAGSNINVPTCRYATVVDQFVAMAGDPEHIDRVYISAKGTYNTWKLSPELQDDPPNDGTYVEVGKYVSINDHTITGLSRFRDKLLVMFGNATVIGTLDTYDGDLHVPSFNDVLEGYGTIAHKSIIPQGNDVFMCDLIGVPSVKLGLQSAVFRPDRVSQLVDQDIQAMLVQLNIGTQEDRIFAVQNDREGQYMLFIPNANGDDCTETVCFVYTNIPILKVSAWSKFRGWNFRSACTSPTGRVFFTQGANIYLYGAAEDPYWDDLGEPITFDYESPWTDFGNRLFTKILRYVALDTRGAAEFTISAHTDDIYKDRDGNYDPYAELDFFAGDTGYGYGDPGDQPYGAGRLTDDMRLFGMEARLKLLKLRIHGQTTKLLRIVAITLGYLVGTIR